MNFEQAVGRSIAVIPVVDVVAAFVEEVVVTGDVVAVGVVVAAAVEAEVAITVSTSAGNTVH